MAKKVSSPNTMQIFGWSLAMINGVNRKIKFQLPEDVDLDVRVRTVVEKLCDDAAVHRLARPQDATVVSDGVTRVSRSVLTAALIHQPYSCTTFCLQLVAHFHNLHICQHLMILLHRPLSHKHGKKEASVAVVHGAAGSASHEGEIDHQPFFSSR